MKKLFVFTLGFVVLLVSLNACKKDIPTTLPDDAALLQDFFQRNLVPIQNFTIDASAGGVINTAESTRITFPPNALLTAAGQPVTGNVTIAFREVNRKADFFLSNKPTIANELPLETGGSWKIGISKDGVSLRINPAVGIRLNIKRDSTQQGEMQLFNAAPKGGDGNAINWGNPRPQQTVAPVDVPFRSYSFKLDSIGWGNADKFMFNPIYLPNIRVKAKNGEPLNNFSGMFIYQNRRIAWPLRKSGNDFLDGHIAKGQPGHFVVAGYLGGVFTTGVLQNITLTDGNQTFEITLTPNTEAAFKLQLNGFL